MKKVNKKKQLLRPLQVGAQEVPANIHRGYEWGLVFSVICPHFLVFAVIMATFLMFTVSGKNTVKCLECFFRLITLTIFTCSSKIMTKMGIDRATRLLLCVHCVVPQPLKFCFHKHVFKRFSFSIRNQGRLLEYLSESWLFLY